MFVVISTRNLIRYSPVARCNRLSNETKPHIPVMLEQALELLAVEPGERVWVDATAGAGGHLSEIIKRSQPGGTVFGIDRDPLSLEKLHQRLGDSCKLVHANYSDIADALAEHQVGTVTGGILADLGVSSMQLDNPERGFSFLRDGPLDMRMDTTARLTAQQLVNTTPERDLADIIYKFGEEKLSRQIARRIVEQRPINSTAKLAEIVSQVVGRHRRKSNHDESHPATRTFQAIRMAVNEELSSLEKFMQEAINLLAPGARLVVITFHSLEDRLVKQFLRQAASPCICPPRQPICTCNKKSQIKVLTPKPLLPETQETLANPRSRSAKLRAGEKT